MPKPLNLTPALHLLQTFYAEHSRLPSLSEIATLLGYSSRNAAVYVVDKLVDKGLLEKGAGGKLRPTALFKPGVKLLGSVSAGFPTPEEEELCNTLSLEDLLIKKASATYMLRVKGDSMIGAGILPGDYVLVEKGKTAKSGDIVIAQVDNEWTMKYFRRKQGRICLEAANPKYPDIYPGTELSVGGVVVANCRRYQ